MCSFDMQARLDWKDLCGVVCSCDGKLGMVMVVFEVSRLNPEICQIS